MDGILNIDKPAGRTSFQIVALVKKLSGVRHVGHAGTLDPIATGVLPVFLGRGTRLVEFLMEERKTYRAGIELGVATDTYDVSGTVVSRSDPSGITPERLESALALFRGDIVQTLPPYSAVKYHGTPLYRLARSGAVVAPPRRTVTVHRLELLSFLPPLVTIEVECSKGTYIRSLAHELGQALGCGASMASLARVRYGPFDIRDAAPVDRLTEAFRQGYWTHFVHPVDAVLYRWDAMIVGGSERAIEQGKPLPAREPPAPPREPRCRVYTASGCFLGTMRFQQETSLWQPHKVFPAPC